MNVSLSQEAEKVVQEAQEELGTDEIIPPEVEMARDCPKCGKQSAESAWYCIDCGTTLVEPLAGGEPLSGGGGEPAPSTGVGVGMGIGGL